VNFLETFLVAARALLRNKTRSFLTTLGIIIGVGAVIAMFAMGEGSQASVQQAIASMGTNILIVLSGSSQGGGARGGFGSMPTLTWEDLKAIQTEVPSVRYAAPNVGSTAQILSEDQNWSTRITGTTPDYFLIRNWPASMGNLITQTDADLGSKVIVLGQTVVDKLFGENANPVGQSVRVNNIPFTIIGVMAKKGQSALGQDYDDAAFIPVSTFEAKVRKGLGKFINGIVFVGAVSAAATPLAQRQITELLRDRHHLAPGIDDDFNIRNLSEIASAQEQAAATGANLLLGIALVSLVVGGIGIMNIMLVSVTERTREIGVRMAIGARPKDILAQFLIEALTLSTVGGLIGIAVGLLGGKRLTSQWGWQMTIQPLVILVAVIFSAAVGIVFGLYPARKASLLDPIDALRYE
jgi:putative ABC transport system permease protein